MSLSVFLPAKSIGVRADRQTNTRTDSEEEGRRGSVKGRVGEGKVGSRR